MRRHLRSVALAFAVLTAAPLASAETAGATAADVEAAKKLFEAGAQAYSSGQFTAAIQAFEQALKVVPKPAILFSLAQAERRQYFLDKNPATLRASIKNFRSYIEQVPEGGRRVDAAQALSELEILESRLADATSVKPAPKEPARLMVMSRTPGATASIDGGEAKPVPVGVVVTPGKHKVRVAAKGHYAEEREPVAIENTIVPVDMNLRAMPATLVVDGPSGAEISIDGHYAGTVGEVSELQVPAGARYVTLNKPGREPVALELELGRGERRQVTVPLRMTRQRYFALGVLGLAGVGAVTAGVTGVIALGHERDAKAIETQRRDATITTADVAVYDRQVLLRDRFVGYTTIAGGVALGAGLVGAGLWFFDRATPPSAPAVRDSAKPAEPAPKSEPEPTEIGIGPGPGVAGASLVGRF